MNSIKVGMLKWTNAVFRFNQGAEVISDLPKLDKEIVNNNLNTDGTMHNLHSPPPNPPNMTAGTNVSDESLRNILAYPPPEGRIIRNSQTCAETLLPLRRRRHPDDTVHVLSCLYAKLLVMVTLVLVLTEVMDNDVNIHFFHGYIFTYLLGGAVICLLYIYIAMMINKRPELTGSASSPLEGTVDPEAIVMRRRISYYSSDISIYIRVGSLVFGFGTLILLGLEITAHSTQDVSCVNKLSMAQPSLQALFTLLQMVFLFLNAQEIICSLGWFRHIALMHVVATNVAVWIRQVTWEVAREWENLNHLKINSKDRWPLDSYNFTLHTFNEKGDHSIFFTRQCRWRIQDGGKMESMTALINCLQNSKSGWIWDKSTPFLYSFVIQYSLIGSVMTYYLWKNINAFGRRQRKSVISEYEDDACQTTYFTTDCRGANKGLFLGLLVLVAGIMVIVLFYVRREDDTMYFDALFANVVLHSAILFFSTIAVFIGLARIPHLSPRNRRARKLNGFLQHIGVLAAYGYGLFGMVVGGLEVHSVKHMVLFIDGGLIVINSFLQSLFIHQVLRRSCGYKEELLKARPGRQVVTFLVFSNMALWLMETFTAQDYVTSRLQLNFFGERVWGIICRVLMPLMVFYRFHSSAALMDAWRNAYKPKNI
ncbi:proton channel OtopLc-like isoform X2 [Tachypleus tridentatus]|uniref:proton channel OtopLc-like isoform X2 n=1 Tax=Tachypleus tridentatus TaxID=6853 RepID=UPI003FD62F2E